MVLTVGKRWWKCLNERQKVGKAMAERETGGTSWSSMMTKVAASAVVQERRSFPEGVSAMARDAGQCPVVTMMAAGHSGCGS